MYEHIKENGLFGCRLEVAYTLSKCTMKEIGFYRNNIDKKKKTKIQMLPAKVLTRLLDDRWYISILFSRNTHRACWLSGVVTICVIGCEQVIIVT